jgi:2,4-dienoyl-CoA reductase-like NADH-dependent reductase (Old Yellow Enzyme family)
MSLFSPLRLRGVEVPNRVVISPMSQYRAGDGFANPWHLVQLGRYALGGAGLVFCEATAVEERGRRTPGDLGIWREEHVPGLAEIASFLASEGAVPGIQLGHAGRKASERRPWHGGTPLDDEDKTLRGEAAWRAVAPSALSFDKAWPTPQEMSLDEIAATVAAFGDAAARALEAGFKVIEVYAAHGFLIHEFYSPASNQRSDEYGGDFAGRTRFVREVAEAIRAVWPDELPLFFRISATDWLDDGWTIDDSVELAKALKDRGVDVIDCSSGGIGGDQRSQRIPLGHGYQVPFAEQIRNEADIATMAVGMIWDPEAAASIITEGRADLIALAREALDDPNWALHAAATLGVDAGHDMWKPEFGWWLGKREKAIKKLGLR